MPLTVMRSVKSELLTPWKGQTAGWEYLLRVFLTSKIFALLLACFCSEHSFLFWVWKDTSLSWLHTQAAAIHKNRTCKKDKQCKCQNANANIYQRLQGWGCSNSGWCVRSRGGLFIQTAPQRSTHQCGHCGWTISFLTRTYISVLVCTTSKKKKTPEKSRCFHSRG